LKRLELARSIESPIKATLENWTSALVFTVVAEKGKTSVLRLVELPAQEDSMICLRLNPSLVADSINLEDVLLNQRIKFDP